MAQPLGLRLRSARCVLTAAAVLHCSSCSSPTSGIECSSVSPDAATTTDEDTCYPDNDGVNDFTYTIEIAVNDTGFTSTDGNDAGAKNIIATQNESQVTLTLTNNGTVPHGFQVGCVSVCSSYPTLPAGCSPLACFPANSTIAPIAPGTSATVTFLTPTPDGLIYPFSSSAPGDSSVPGLNSGQWSLM
jgi:hypothetical protein